MRILVRVGQATLVAVPAGLTLYLSFNAGGFYLSATGIACAATALVLVLKTCLEDNPFGGLTGPAALAAGALALLAVWTLASASWSDATGRAIPEFVRALLYLLVFILAVSSVGSPARLAWTVRAMAAAMVLVAALALVSRLAPDLLSTQRNLQSDRLSWPLTYWNALGLLAVVGMTLCFHLSADRREPAVSSALAAAAVPVLATSALLTFSRGAMAAAALALAVYMLVGRPRGLLGGLLATLPTAAIAVYATYSAELLTSDAPTLPAVVREGHRIALIVALCAIGAGALRLLLRPLDLRLERIRVEPRTARRVAAGAAVMAVSLLVVALLLPGTRGYADRQYKAFVSQEPISQQGDPRDRLTSYGNNGRIDQWAVALDGYHAAPLKGSGAGTYRLLWEKGRDSDTTITDAHSLYVETLGELGLVGLVLLLIALLSLMVGLALRLRSGGSRAPYAAVLAAGAAWSVHAAIDWDWEMPAVTLWLFALAGSALAAPPGARRRLPLPSRTSRIVIALVWLLLAVLPVLGAVSERRLDRSREAFRRGDCSATITAALDSLGALGARAEPWELIGICDVRLGSEQLAVRALQNAVERDPGNWEFRYGLALALGAAGRDPRPALGQAVRLNPREPLPRKALRRFHTGDPKLWERRARKAPLYVR